MNFCVPAILALLKMKVEVLIIKSQAHRDLKAAIKKLPNPVYLLQSIVLRRGAKGTGMKSIELALSMCDVVDIYGFTVDPGYKEWFFIYHKTVELEASMGKKRAVGIQPTQTISLSTILASSVLFTSHKRKASVLQESRLG